jgi:RNA polymerase sigma factor (sigma-70 family)
MSPLGAPKASSPIEQLESRYRVPLRHFFERRLKARPDPEDLVQEVFIRLVRQSELSDVRHLDGYVFQIAANVLRDYARRWSIRVEEFRHSQLEDEVLEGGFSPERVVLGQEALEHTLAALQQLPEKTQLIFSLYHFESISQTDIARRLKVSLSTVEKHMNRANLHLLSHRRSTE